MKSLTLVLTLTVLVLVGFLSTPTAYAASSVSMKDSQWAIYEQNTLPNDNLHFYPAAHGTTFSMPDATGASPTFVNYMLNKYTGSLNQGNTITAEINVSPTPGTVFLGDTFGGSNLATPVFARLFIQANLPNDGSATCVGGHANVNNYWWADVQAYTFPAGGGSLTMTVPLVAANWSGICGNPASADQLGFNLALQNIKYVGLSFGSGYFFASGVGIDGSSGSATFQLISYNIS